MKAEGKEEPFVWFLLARVAVAATTSAKARAGAAIVVISSFGKNRVARVAGEWLVLRCRAGSRSPWLWDSGYSHVSFVSSL